MTDFNQSVLVRRNMTERERLRALIDQSTDADLSVALSAGWTVAAVLAHLAFWDRRALDSLERWEKEGVGPSPIDDDEVNDASKGLFVALPPRVAAREAVDAADAVDAKVAGLSATLIALVRETDQTWLLERNNHRRLHLYKIEATLHGRRGG